MEQHKYEQMWAHEAYRVVAPGVYCVPTFLEVANPRKGETLRDLGCGTGRAGKALADAGLVVTQYDFAENCRDAGIDLPFVVHDLTRPLPEPPADYAFCTDVLEHIPPDDVLRVLRNVVAAGRRVFLQISCEQDRMGALIGEALHLTVQPASWWREQLESFEARILWERDDGHSCMFYVSGYATALEFPEKTVLNVAHSVITDNVRANLALGLPEVEPHEITDRPLMLLAGGPSLMEFKDEIIARRKAGEYLVTVNGTHNLCREWGIEPSIHIMCDARDFNRRFVEHPFPRTRYLIASQCDPAIAASLPRDQVLIWHSGDHLRDTIKAWDDEHGVTRTWYPVFGGGTVVLRGIPLLMMLGFRKFELFGFDSCLTDGEHHAYSQPENDRRTEIAVHVGGRTFMCHPWMVAQAGDFLRLMKVIGPHIDLSVRGDALIANIIKSAAETEED